MKRSAEQGKLVGVDDLEDETNPKQQETRELASLLGCLAELASGQSFKGKTPITRLTPLRGTYKWVVSCKPGYQQVTNLTEHPRDTSRSLGSSTRPAEQRRPCAPLCAARPETSKAHRPTTEPTNERSNQPISQPMHQTPGKRHTVRRT